jgi:hypothetical protein
MATLVSMSLLKSVFQPEIPRGVDFVQQNSPTPQKYLIETMGGGVAILDHNNDGLPDLFFVNSGRLASGMTLSFWCGDFFFASSLRGCRLAADR